MSPHGFSPDRSEFLSLGPCPVIHNKSPGSLSSDAEDGVPYQPGDGGIAPEDNFMPPLLENGWHDHEEQHFPPSFLEDKSFLEFFY